jgi:hypothetical protein
LVSQITVDAPCTQSIVDKLLRVFCRGEALRVDRFFNGVRILVLKNHAEVGVLVPNGNLQPFWHLFARVAQGHHFTASLKRSLNILTMRKMITSNNKMPAVIARMRNPFSRMLSGVIIG